MISLFGLYWVVFKFGLLCFGGGESMLRVAARIYSLLDELRRGDETCLLVAHNGIARVVNSYFHDMTNAEYAAFGIQNCEIRQYDFE